MSSSQETTFNTDTITRTFQTASFEKDTRISQAAAKASAEYLRIFTREAFYRAALSNDNKKVDTSDLSKVAGTLILDF
ncbi:hypothetical protein TRVA0_045S00276 [Trichomonascus vanleenenianus]|uniref:CENP-X/MHF2 family protein n=1 Tax=Trichomonascus vanleenenianus TaxID=2268995 RepID=UPI003ECADBB5